MKNSVIKFRCWDIIRKQLVYGFTKSVVCEDGTEFEFEAFAFRGGSSWSKEIVSLTRALTHPDRYVVQESTGRLSKDKVEIYRGDKIRYEKHYGDMRKKQVEAKVVRDDWRCGFKPFINEDESVEKVEVIGNIYENHD